jgi:hypothetical protein
MGGHRGLVHVIEEPYRLIGSNGNPIGWTPWHPDSHFLTSTAMAKLRELGYWYSTVTFPFNARLYINDASLERGGFFDINQDWKAPHLEHCRGTVVDIRANGADGALNITSRTDPMIRKIQELASNLKIDAMWEIPQDDDGKEIWETRHFHVRLMGRGVTTLCP